MIEDLKIEFVCGEEAEVEIKFVIFVDRNNLLEVFILSV